MKKAPKNSSSIRFSLASIISRQILCCPNSLSSRFSLISIEEASSATCDVISARRASWRILSSIEQKEESKGNEGHVKAIRDYRQKVESEHSNICMDIMTVIDEHLVPSTTVGESSVFY